MLNCFLAKIGQKTWTIKQNYDQYDFDIQKYVKITGPVPRTPRKPKSPTLLKRGASITRQQLTQIFFRAVENSMVFILYKHKFFHYDLSKDIVIYFGLRCIETIAFFVCWNTSADKWHQVSALTLRLQFLRIWTCPNEPLLIIDLWLFSFCNGWLWLFDCIGRSQAACMAEQRTATEIGSSTPQLRIGSETPFHHPITCTPTVRVRGPSKSIINTDLREKSGIF